MGSISRFDSLEVNLVSLLTQLCSHQFKWA